MSQGPTLIQRLAQSRYGAKVQSALDSISPPVDITWSEFAAGYNVSDSIEDIGPSANAGGADMEVNKKDQLVRAPGVSLLETLTRTPKSVALHPNVNLTSELIFFDPPYFGLKASGNTSWFDVGLRAGHDVVTAVYADVLVLTNGYKTYYRNIRDTTITEIPEASAGEAIAVFGARIIMGAAYVGGSLEGLAVTWSDAEGDFKSWTGLGAGNEFLLSGGPESDRIVAMKNMNLDLLAILNRRSIWVAGLTGNGFAPFAFSLRIKGVGCVNAKTAQSTDRGVIFLSEDGVRGFDGNSSDVLSDAINPELLPLIAEGVGYSSSYDAITHRYYLFTPAGPTYVLDILKGRWYKWSRTYTFGVDFPIQSVPFTWFAASAIGLTWDTVTGTWDEKVTHEGAHRHLLINGTALGLEDAAVETNFGAVFYPKWSMPLALGDILDQMFRTDLVEVRHEGAGTVRFNLPDNDGLYTAGSDLILVAGTSKIAKQNPTRTGLGMGLQVEIRSGSPKIGRVHLQGRFQGRRQ